VSTPTPLTDNLRLYCQSLMFKAGKMALKAFGRLQTYQLKDDQSYLTVTDQEIDSFIHYQIHHDYPKYHIFSEETKSHLDTSKPTFILDPIDGTTNFIQGIPVFGPQIAFLENGELAVAAIYDTVSNIMISASKLDGVFINNQPIVLKPQPIEQITLLFDTGRNRQLSYQFLRSSLLPIFRSYRRFGSLITDIIFLLHQHYGVFLGFRSNLYDFAPAACILKIAGYQIFDDSLIDWVPKETISLFAMHSSITGILKPQLKLILSKEA
jgi:myo-inositol-1(or 4)-monophosphatase